MIGRMARLLIELDREDDGRWIADVPALPGVLAYGPTREAALSQVRVLALRTIADRIEHGEAAPDVGDLFDVAPGDGVAA